MRFRRFAIAVFLVPLAAGAARPGEDGPGPRPAADAALERLVAAARACAGAALRAADAELAAAETLVADAAAAARPAAARSFTRAQEQVTEARALLAAAPDAIDVRAPVAALGRAATALGRGLRRSGPAADGECVLVETTAGANWLHGPGRRATFRVSGGARGTPATLAAENDAATVTAVETSVRALGGGRFRVRWGPRLGGARLVAARGDATTSRAVFNVGPPDALAQPLPAVPAYGPATVFARVGSTLDAVGPVAPEGGGAYEAEGLPDGLVLDPATGAIGGVAETSGPAVTVRVTVRNVRGAASGDVRVDVDPALPEGVVALAGGFRAERVLGGLDVPVKMALAPDGRLFFNELLTGQVRVVGADGALRATPFAVVPVLTGVERGLLGLALAPDFAHTGEVYVFASTAAGDGKPDRNRVLRYVASGDTGTGPAVVVDDLPIGLTLNGGDVQFGGDGRLYVSTGATGDDEASVLLPQTDGSLAGRVLRLARDGSVPADNPVPGSPEWARGFRNPFDLAFDPGSGGFFAVENGTNAHDELNYVQRGRNFGWGADPGASFGSLTGIRMRDWTPVIAPTCVAVVPDGVWDDGAGRSLLLGSYDAVEVRRLVVSGVDLVSEDPFLTFDPVVFENRPLDVVVTPAGEALVSTFDSVWRVVRD